MDINMRRCKFCLIEGSDDTFANAGNGTYKNICKKCNNKKALNDFVKKSKSKDGFGIYCKQCEYEWNKKSYYRTSGDRNKYLIERRRRIAKERDKLMRSLNLKCKYLNYK